VIPPTYKQYSDGDLVSFCLQGDPQAWETLVLRYKRLIYSIPLRFSFTAADAADIFQSICLKLIEHLHELRDERRLSSWLITTTTRHCIYLRSQRCRETGSNEDDLIERPDPTENLEEMRLLIEEQQTVRESVELLPDRCRELIELLYFDSHTPSYEEVGQILSMPVPSVGPTRARCLEKLRTILRRKGIK
jgi:RNA polymerase sigma factor (sigma-70 family)